MSDPEQNQHQEDLPAPKPPHRVWVAVLQDSIFMGATPSMSDQVGADDVVFDHCPDNAPGRYRWDGACLQPIPPAATLPASIPLDVSAMRALRALIEHTAATSGPLPAACTDWATAFDKTLDAN